MNKQRNKKGQFTKGMIPHNKKDYVGQRFGRLVVVADTEPKIQPSGQTKRQVICDCDCGTKGVVVRLECLKNGSTASCGCLKSEKSRERMKKPFNDHEDCGEYIKVFDDAHENYFIVDKEDLDIVSKYRWCKDPSNYWVCWDNSKITRVHQILFGTKCDHKDGNPSNNRRSNLRPCSDMQNAWNTSKHKDNRSGYKGVYKKRNRYCARICKNGIKETIGYADTPEEAARLYDKRAKELFGEWARLNFPESAEENF